MDLEKAWEIVHKYTYTKSLSEIDMFLFEEALNYILQVSEELSELDDMWEADVEAGAYNLAAYYEQIEKYELAIKYYELSEKYGCWFAREAINRIRDKI